MALYVTPTRKVNWMSTESFFQSRHKLNPALRVLIWLAIIAGCILCVFDVLTSIWGIQMIVGFGDYTLIPMTMPVLFAILSICFNGVSGYLFAELKRRKGITFTTAVAAVMWIFFLAYDGISSFIGMLSVYSGKPVTSFETAITAMRSLGTLASVFIVIMALLLAFGPFLVTLFWSLLKQDSNEGEW